MYPLIINYICMKYLNVCCISSGMCIMYILVSQVYTIFFFIFKFANKICISLNINSINIFCFSICETKAFVAIFVKQNTLFQYL
jgi:hypothetical protein